MLPVTQTSLVSRMSDRKGNARMSEDLQRFVRLEYNGDGAEVRRMVAQARRTARPANGNTARRGFLSALFGALASAFPRPGGV